MNRIMMSSHECITQFCKSTGLSHITKLVLTAETGEPVKVEVTCLADGDAVERLLESTYQFTLIQRGCEE